MLEIKVSIEAVDLSNAIMQLATAINKSTLPDAQTMFAPVMEQAPAAEEAVAPVPAAPTAPVAPVAPAAPAAEEAVAPTPVADDPPKVIDLDAISRAGASLIDMGKMDDLLAVLHDKYKLDSVTQLSPDQYPAFAEELRALGADI